LVKNKKARCYLLVMQTSHWHRTSSTKVHTMSEKASDYFKRLAAAMPALEQEIVRDVIAVEAERIHAENFRAEAFIDTPVDKWQPRIEDLRGGYYSSIQDASAGLKSRKAKRGAKKRALLVKTSTLKGHALKGRTRNGAVEFVFPLEYERVHNEGLRAGRGSGFKMPKRQFVGESKVLTERINKKAKKLIDYHLKKL